MSDTVYLVQCCHAATVEKTLGPIQQEFIAEIIAGVIERHFYNGGDQYCRVEERTVIE